jgi:hypothetical protein
MMTAADRVSITDIPAPWDTYAQEPSGEMTTPSTAVPTHAADIGVFVNVRNRETKPSAPPTYRIVPSGVSAREVGEVTGAHVAEAKVVVDTFTTCDKMGSATYSHKPSGEMARALIVVETPTVVSTVFVAVSMTDTVGEAVLVT